MPTFTPLQIEYDRFLDANGSQWNWGGHISFMAYKRSLDGEPLPDFVNLPKQCGSQVLVTLQMAHYIEQFYPAEYGDRYFAHMRPFAAALRDLGMYWCPIVFVDAQVVLPNRDQQQRFLSRLAEATAGEWNILPSLGNEYPKNGFNPSDFTRPNNGLLWSRGSSLADTAPYYPSWDWKEFHPRRDWPKVLDGNFDGHYVMDGLSGNDEILDKPAPAISSEPIGFWHTDIPNRRSSDPNLAMVIGGTSIYYMRGGNFHSEEGLRSQPWSGRTEECARRYFKALRQNE